MRIPSASNPARTRSHKMVKKAGGWRLDVDSKVESLSEPEVAVFGNLNRPLEQSVKDVRAGKYVRIEDAIQTMKANVMAAARVER